MRFTVAFAGLVSLLARAQADTLVDAVVKTEELSILETAVVEAGLVETLSGDGPFT